MESVEETLEARAAIGPIVMDESTSEIINPIVKDESDNVVIDPLGKREKSGPQSHLLFVDEAVSSYVLNDVVHIYSYF